MTAFFIGLTKTDILFLIHIILSVLVLCATVIFSVKRARSHSEIKHLFSALRILTFGTFISCIIIHLPFYYYGEYIYHDGYTFFRPFIMSIHSTLQAFVLGFNYRDLMEDIPELNDVINAVYTCIVAILYIIAPILTLTNILSLFNAFLSELKIKRNFFRRKPLYVFSEMNGQSIAIAQSIAENYQDSKKNNGNQKKLRKPLLVFTDFYPSETEPDQDMLQSAQNLKAVCVKTDITHLKLNKKRYPIEFFIIGGDESENMEQAIKLNDEYKDSSKCSVYLYSAKPNAGYILDSIDKGKHTITSRKLTPKDAEDFLDNKESAKEAYSSDNSYYYIRRVNVVNSFTIKALTDSALMQKLSEQARSKKTISVMIVGLGLYGTAFLKNALWLYQFKGCTLKIHVIESEKKETLRDKIAKEMPGLSAHLCKDEASFLHYCSDTEGDCLFDVFIYHSIDCESSHLNDLILQQNKFEPAAFGDVSPKELPNRFIDVYAAFVTLGDDNKNIETAVILRGLFDRIKHIKNKDLINIPANELPLLYSVVYDNRTAQNLNCGNNGKNSKDDKNNTGIICYNDIPYHIHFIGRMSEHFHYDTIREMKKQEAKAICHHVEWIQNESALRECFRTDPKSVKDKKIEESLTKFQKEMQADFTAFYGGEEVWYDRKFYYTGKDILKKKGSEKFRRKTGSIKKKLKLKTEWIKTKAVENNVNLYDQYEYYRDSSVAKETYCKLIRDDAFKEYFEENFNASNHIEEKPYEKICSCKKCIAFRESEHMRWNAYGYRYDPIRNDRAKTHPNIQPWHSLPVSDKYKD